MRFSCRIHIGMTPLRLYSPAELAKEVGRSEKFIRAAIKTGLEHHRETERSRIYVTLEQWNSWLEARRVAADGRPVSKKSRPRRNGRPVRARRDPSSYVVAAS